MGFIPSFYYIFTLHEPLLPLNIESDDIGGAKIIARELAEFLGRFDKLDVKSSGIMRNNRKYEFSVNFLTFA